MMTHIFSESNGRKIIAAKGAPEALINVSHLNDTEKQQIHSTIELLATEGYRVLGVGVSNFAGEDYPDQQQDLPFEFMLNALRLYQKISFELFQQRTGLDFSSIETLLRQAQQQGLLTYDSVAMETTELGKRFYNNLLTLFMRD
jgi:coproporphyrinogen III oxidase-like Fe-S oxidoreductase